MLIDDLAHDLLDDVFQGHETHQRAVLVDDEGEMSPPLAEGIELLLERRRLRHEPGLGHDRHDVEAVEIGEVGMDRPQQVLGVQDAHDVVRLALPDRKPRVGAADDLIQDVGGPRPAVDHLHGLAMRHDRADVDFVQVENAVEHVVLVLDHLALARLQGDGAAQLLFGDARRSCLVGGTGHAECRRDHQSHRADDGGEQPYDGSQHRPHAKGDPVGLAHRIGLGQDLGEDHDDDRHADRRVGHARIADDRYQHTRSQCGGKNVDGVVAEQDGTDQTLTILREPLNRACTSVPGAGEMVHARAGGCGQRGFGSGEEAR